MKRTVWNKKDIELLKQLYEKDGLSVDQIFLIFKENNKFRTKDAIHIKVTRLKLRHSKEQTFKIKSALMSGEKNPMFGKESPNRGLTKENSERIRTSSKKLSLKRKQMFIDGLLPDVSGEKNPMFGKIAWSRGLTKETDERIARATKIAGEHNKNLWKTKTDEEKKIVIDRLNNAMINQHKPTKIEIIMLDYLQSIGVSFVKNHSINGFYVDFYLDEINFVIECDGDYWHANPKFYKNKILSTPQIKNIDRDLRKNKMMSDNNIKYLRFWENDIIKNFEEVKNKISNILK